MYNLFTTFDHNLCTYVRHISHKNANFFISTYISVLGLNKAHNKSCRCKAMGSRRGYVTNTLMEASVLDSDQIFKKKIRKK